MSDEGVVHFHTKETTVRSILASALNACDDYGAVVVICKTKDGGEIAIGHSDAYLLEKIGMCEFAAHTFKDDMYNGF